MWYGLGRAWIEGVRTDTLKLFGWTLFDQPIRVSQLLSVLLVIAGAAILIVNKRKYPKGQDNLYVNKLAAMEAAKETEAASAEAQEAVSEAEETAEAAEDIPAETGETAEAGEEPAGETEGSTEPVTEEAEDGEHV